MIPRQLSCYYIYAILLVAACKTTKPNESDLKFYGADNQSAIMLFDAEIEFNLPKNIKSKEALLIPPHAAEIQELIDWQVKHLYGAFTTHDAFRKNPGILEGKGKTKVISAEIDAAEGRGRVRYSHSDRVVFKKKVLNSPNPTITFVLPRAPVEIYSKGVTDSSGFNHCTDEHYNSESDFWYFWNPNQKDCPIRPEDLVEVTAKLSAIPNTKSTYPDYEKILGDNGNGKTIKIIYLIGVDENFKAGDLGSGTYQEAFDLLRANKFKVKSSIRRKSVLTYTTPNYEVEVDLRLMDPGSKQFVAAAADGLETADIFIYDGHSGLGGYLYTDRFESALGRPLKLPATKSQIFYFNGCSTFAYYNADYFNLKKSDSDPDGKKFLDIITTSIGASFDIGARHDIEVITSLVDGSRPSWQTIMDKVYKADRKQTALSHVNGDEDNPSTPGNQ